jgi:hypothetical protein
MLKLGGCRIVIISHVTRPPMQAANFCSKHGGRWASPRRNLGSVFARSKQRAWTGCHPTRGKKELARSQPGRKGVFPETPPKAREGSTARFFVKRVFLALVR